MNPDKMQGHCTWIILAIIPDPYQPSLRLVLIWKRSRINLYLKLPYIIALMHWHFRLEQENGNIWQKLGFVWRRHFNWSAVPIIRTPIFTSNLKRKLILNHAGVNLHFHRSKEIYCLVTICRHIGDTWNVINHFGTNHFIYINSIC